MVYRYHKVKLQCGKYVRNRFCHFLVRFCQILHWSGIESFIAFSFAVETIVCCIVLSCMCSHAHWKCNKFADFLFIWQLPWFKNDFSNNKHQRCVYKWYCYHKIRLLCEKYLRSGFCRFFFVKFCQILALIWKRNFYCSYFCYLNYVVLSSIYRHGN